MPSQPVRKFAPTPVEMTIRSSKNKETNSQTEPPSIAKPRFFPPVPVETTLRSTKDARPNTPETGDFRTIKHEHKNRRFVPEPVEMTSRSSKNKKEEEGDKEKDKKAQKPRRFAVQPLETTHKSSKESNKKDTNIKTEEKATQSHIKFAPQFVETTHIGSSDRGSLSTSSSSSTSTKPVRRFAPMLIDSARRSRKVGDSSGASLSTTDRTEQGHLIAAREHRRHITGVATPLETDSVQDASSDKRSALDLTGILDEQTGGLRRSVSPFDGTSSRARSQQRQHSFRCPDLDTIESSESDGESSTSSSPPDATQGSPITASDSSFHEYKHATRVRESIDENFANYFIQLEAKRAEQRLREQALAAFANSDFHEPVQHYVNAERDSDSGDSIDYRPVTYDEDEDTVGAKAVRRESTKVPWEQLEMQRHAEKLDEDRRANQITAAHSPGGNDPWWAPGYNTAQADHEMRSMRDRARPPMLGSDISFPRCQSPKPARFDVTQGSVALRNQMCYLSEHAETESKQSDNGPVLWSSRVKKPQNPAQSTKTSKSSASKGLWGGFCASNAKSSAQGGLTVPMMPSGIVTPRQESLNPFEKSFSFPNGIEMSGVVVQTPPTPSANDEAPRAPTIDGVLNSERQLDAMLKNEFPDSFVTQVYNYLSLGYPSLARPFDAELSKISRVSIEELRQDDHNSKASPRGYIKLGPEVEGCGSVDNTETCRRWIALKVYIREWARQEKTTTTNFDSPGAEWATTARRGSWGN